MTVVFLIDCLLKVFLGLVVFLIVVIAAVRLFIEPIKAVCRCNVNLKGKVALITGGNSGIGLETARDLANRGATVIIASRDEEKSKKAVKDIIDTTGNSNVHHKSLNLGKFSSIKKFAEDFNQSYNRLDILVNNAGCAGLKPSLTEDQIEKVTQINYVGPFLLTNLLTDKIVASKPSRIVIVSSKANEFHNLNPDDVAAVKCKPTSALGIWKIYANSKLLNILWTKALAKRMPAGVTVNALHPGIVRTEIFNKLPESLRGISLWIIGAFFKSSKEGAQTSIHLCVAPELDGVTGEYFAECKIAAADKLTRDDKMVEKVWDNTMKLIK